MLSGGNSLQISYRTHENITLAVGAAKAGSAAAATAVRTMEVETRMLREYVNMWNECEDVSVVKTDSRVDRNKRLWSVVS